MELDCGSNKGGWMRIADIDTSRGDACPSGWISYNSYCTGGLSAGCHSTHFSTNSTSYNKVGGKVVGYQKGNMDGFLPSAYSTSVSLDGVYVDGISITYGNPSKHVWTYAVGASEDSDYIYSNYTCPCADYSGPDPPVYISSHYCCESSRNRGRSVTSEFFILMTPYGMEQVAYLKTTVVLMLHCHGSSVNCLQLQLEILKSEYATMSSLAMKV